MTFTIADAELSGIVVHTLLYGIFVVLFIGTLHVLVFKHRKIPSGSIGRPGRMITNKFLLAVSIVLFALITAHWIIQISRLFDAFIRFPNMPGGPSAYYFNQKNPKNVAKTALYVAQTFIGDITIVYRLYIVWGRNKFVIILPILSTLALLGGGTTVCWSFSQLQADEDFFSSKTGRYILIVFAMSLFTNISVTALLTYRILSVNRATARVFHQSIGSKMKRAINIVLESAALYTVCLIMTHVTYLFRHPFQFVALDATSPTIGISFGLIIVRVGLGIATEAQGTYSTHSARGPAVDSGARGPPQPLAVKVSQHVTTQIDGVGFDAPDDGDSFSHPGFKPEPDRGHAWA